MPNDGDLLDYLLDYAPDEARKKILVDNPARLFDCDARTLVERPAIASTIDKREDPYPGVSRTPRRRSSLCRSCCGH